MMSCAEGGGIANKCFLMIRGEGGSDKKVILHDEGGEGGGGGGGGGGWKKVIWYHKGDLGVGHKVFFSPERVASLFSELFCGSSLFLFFLQI